MNKHTATKTPPPTQNVSVIVSSIPCQLDAISVQYQGVKYEISIDPTDQKKYYSCMHRGYIDE